MVYTRSDEQRERLEVRRGQRWFGEAIFNTVVADEAEDVELDKVVEAGLGMRSRQKMSWREDSHRARHAKTSRSLSYGVRVQRTRGSSGELQRQMSQAAHRGHLPPMQTLRATRARG